MSASSPGYTERLADTGSPSATAARWRATERIRCSPYRRQALDAPAAVRETAQFREMPQKTAAGDLTTPEMSSRMADGC